MTIHTYTYIRKNGRQKPQEIKRSPSVFSGKKTEVTTELKQINSKDSLSDQLKISRRKTFRNVVVHITDAATNTKRCTLKTKVIKILQKVPLQLKNKLSTCQKQNN